MTPLLCLVTELWMQLSEEEEAYSWEGFLEFGMEMPILDQVV